MLRKCLSIGDTPLAINGKMITVPPWKSSDNHGNPGHPNFHTSMLEDGYFRGRDLRGAGNDAGILSYAGRTTTFYDTGWADVAVSLTWECNEGFPCFPAVCITPDEGYEHDLTTYIEPFFPNFATCVVWAVGQPAWLEGIHCFMSGLPFAYGTPFDVRAEVVERRLCMYVNNVFQGETIVPPHMAGSTLHGISHDTMQKGYRGDGHCAFTSATEGTGAYLYDMDVEGFPKAYDVLANGAHKYYVSQKPSVGKYEKNTGVWNRAAGTMTRATIHKSSNGGLAENWGPGEKIITVGEWEPNPYYTTPEPSALESGFSVVPITHFSHEPAGTLGAELVDDNDFLVGGGWTTDQPTHWTENNTYSATDPVSVPGITVERPSPSGSPFTSGYYDKALASPMVDGQTYRLTIGIISNIASNGFYDVPMLPGQGNITVEFYGLSPAESSGVVLTQTLTSGKTVDFVANGDYTHIRFRGVAVLSDGTYNLNKTVNYVSVREFIEG